MTTSRLRLVFLALALALAVPGALLVARALESVAAERAARERAVAERVFDVMEQSLSAQLAVEEARPASDYEFASAASPLRTRPAGAFAIGWFQIEADGSVSAPTWSPRAAALAAELAKDGVRLEAATPRRGRARSPETPAPAPATVVEEQAAGGAPTVAPPALDAGLAQPAAADGGTASQGVPNGGRAESAAPPVFAPAPGPTPTAVSETDAYEALAKLNTGAKEREERKQRSYVEEQRVASDALAETPSEAAAGSGPRVEAQGGDERLASAARLRSEALVASAIAVEPSAAAPGPTEVETAESAPVDAPVAQRDLAAVHEATPSAPRSATPSQAGNAAIADEAATSGGLVASEAPKPKAEASLPHNARAAPTSSEPAPAARLGAAESAADTVALDGPARDHAALVRVVVDPMRGRLARSGELLLVRSAWIGSRGVRQGVVYDVAALEQLLGTRALAATLADGQIELRSRSLPRADVSLGAGEDSRLSFTHRFAEPFHAFEAQLAFARLGDEGANSVYWLAALFSLAGAGGLFAAYRTTAVALHFAERRSNFAAAVSHELKTPLTAIRLYAEMLRDGLVSGDEKRREYYGSITAETERLSRLINNVLEFSKLERGARSFELSVGDVVPVVREAVELLKPHAAVHGLALKLAADESLPAVRFERDALLQVVFNLVDNAVKYGRGEPARIEVVCLRAGDDVEIRVRDHGPGVPREELARILEPFYRRGDELTRSAPGAGIGLALVRGLVREMGAALAVDNAEGGGFVASVRLARAANA